MRRHPPKVNQRDRWETLREIAAGNARLPSEVRPGFDAGLEKLIMKALADNPDDRYAAAAVFGEAIRQSIKERRKPKVAES